ncbi:hypothetical protein [Actinomadura terrae]|uniref:hypothetical protein n=1 Tax=Actinomadura terrae TaxID=604353 RepID=UPI001FA7F7DB|nr:hypothetical protein [Actinomadura terrae]
MTGSREPGPTGPEHAGDPLDDARITQHKRLVLTLAGVTFLVFMSFPVLTSFTPALDGVVNGIGVAYIVGLALVVAPVLGAMAYRRNALRNEREEGR